MPPGDETRPFGWILGGALLSLVGCAFILKGSADTRRLLPGTVFVRLNGLTSFDEFYDIATSVERSVRAQPVMAVSFDAAQQRGDFKLEKVAGDAGAVRSATKKASSRTLRLRRSRDRLTIDLD